MSTRQRAAIVAALTVLGGLGASGSVAFGQAAAVAPAQRARALEIIAGGSRIGVSIRDIEEADVKTLKGVTTGVVIQDVSSGSPAEKAGIRQGDVVVEFDGERVRSARQLTRLVQETPPDRSVPVVVLRDGQRTSLTVTPTEGGARIEGFDFGDLENFRFRVTPPVLPAPPAPPVPPAWRFDEPFGRTGRLGVTLNTLSPQLAEYFGTKQGVLVTSVTDNSVAAKAGLKAGDVITSINGTPVDEPADVRRRLQELRDGDEITFGVMRDRKPLTLKGQLERQERRSTVRRIV